MEYREAHNTILLLGTGWEYVPMGEATYEHGFIGCLRPWSELSIPGSSRWKHNS